MYEMLPKNLPKHKLYKEKKNNYKEKEILYMSEIEPNAKVLQIIPKAESTEKKILQITLRARIILCQQIIQGAQYHMKETNYTREEIIPRAKVIQIIPRAEIMQ